MNFNCMLVWAVVIQYVLLSKYTCSCGKLSFFAWGGFSFCPLLLLLASLAPLFRGKFPTVSRKLFSCSFLSFLLISSFFLFHVLSFRQSIKSSFRDKDKPSRFKDLQTTTRFQVEPQNEESDDDSNVSQEDRELLNDNEYDTKYGKSFRSV